MLGRTEKKQLKKSESDSELTVCDVCGQNHHTESCLFISTRPCTVEDAVTPTRARLTLPANLTVKDLADGTTTVVTQAKFEKGTRFGPFLAPLTSILPPEVDFPLKIFGKSEEDSYYLDTRNEDDCNWMCLVGSVSSSDDIQNLFCYQVLDKVFFSLLRDIEAGEELRVWYAPFYGVKMGIPPGNLASLSSAAVSEIPDVSDSTKVEEPVTWEADTTTADVPPTEEEPQIAVRRSKRQPKNKRKHDDVDETQKKIIKEKNDEARTAYVAQQLPAIRLGARFSPACWRCRECGVKEVSVINYARHLMQHLKQPARAKKFPCSLCHKKFFTQTLLDEHEATRHGLSGLLPPVPVSEKPVEICSNPDDPLPVQECLVDENELKVPAPNSIFGKSIGLCTKGKDNPESELHLTVSCVQQPCVMGPLSSGTTDVEENLALNERVSMDSCSTLTVIPAAQQDTRTNISIAESVSMKSSIAENCEKLEDNSRKLVAVMGENALQNLLIPIDQHKNLDILLQNFQQPTREKPVSHPAKVPETILNHEFFTRVAGDTVVRDVKSLLSMGYSLQFLVENEDGSSSLVDVLSTANSVSADQVTSSSGASQCGETSTQQLVIMANGNVPDSLPLALQNILPSSVPIVPNVDAIVTPQTPLLAGTPADSDSTATNDIQLPSCLDSERSFLNKQSSTSDARSPLGTLLPSAITNNMCYDSVIPYTDSNSENASLMEMSLGGENLEREELDYELGALELPLTVEDTNSTDYMMNACSTPPPTTVRSSSLCVASNPDLNTPVKLLDRCIEGTLSSDAMTFDFEAGSEVPPASILSPQQEEKNSMCRDGLTKDFSDLIAADAESSNVMLTIQPADSTAEVRKDSSIPSIELSNGNEKDKSSTSLEWMESEGLLLSVQRDSVEHIPETLILNSNEQSSAEVDFQPITVTDKSTSLLKDNTEESGHLQVTTSEISVEFDGLLLDTHSNPRRTVPTQDELQVNLQSQSHMQHKNQIHSQSEIHLQCQNQSQSVQYQQQAHPQMISKTQNQHWLPTHTNISTSAQTQCHSQSQMQNETQIQVQMKSQAQDQVPIELQIHAQTDSNMQAHHQPELEAQQELHASMDLGVITEEMEIEVEQSCISSGPPFICDICNKSFEKVKYLYRHLRKHTGEFTCVACRAVFARKETLQLHECPAQSMRAGGNITDRLSCPFCRKQFTEKKQLTRHIAIHAGSRRFQCTTCDSSFSSKEAAEHHIQRCSRDLPSANEQSTQQVIQEGSAIESDTQQAILPLRCELCRRMFSSDTALFRHKMTVHQDPAQDCEHCGRALALATPERVAQHARFCAPAAALQAGTADAALCPECNEPFRQLLLYRQHVYRHTHPFVCAHCRRSFCSLQEKGKHVCLDLLEQCCRCGHRFGTVPQLERHALTHGVPHYHCYECGRSFHLMTDFNQHRCFELRVKIVRRIPKKVVVSEDTSATTLISSTSLKKYINQNQRSESEEVLMCEICGEVCKSRRTLNVHLLLHGERKIVCGVCGKRFHRKDALVEHMYVHEDAQLRCSICNKLLKSQKSLEAHIRRQHSLNNKRFVCQQCGKEFHQKVNLKKHMKSHDPRPEPVNCPHCGRRFQFPDVLAKHIAEHMEVPRFQCTQCDRSFVKEKSLRQHMTIHGPQGFSCPVCGHTLKHRFSLRRHILKNHPEVSLGRKSTSTDRLEPVPNNVDQPQSPEVLLTVSQLQLTTDGVQEISLPDDVAVENACLLEESAMECSEEMVLYVLQEPLPCLPLQEPSI